MTPKCSAREMLVEWNQMGPPGPPGPQGPPGPGVVVRDANGNLVGALVDMQPLYDPNNANYNSDTPVVRVVRSVGGRSVAFLVGLESSGAFLGFYTFGTVVFQYGSTDCTGPAFLSADSATYNVPRFVNHVPPIPQVFVNGSHGGYQVGPVATHTISSAIIFTDETSCQPGIGGRTFTPPDECCIPQSPTSADVPDAATLDLTTFGLVPPFHVEGP
jgi:hypothetical protein